MNPTAVPNKNSFAPQARGLVNAMADRLLPKTKVVRKAIQCALAGGILAMTSIQGFAAFSYDVVDLGVIPFAPDALLNNHCFTDDGLLVVGYGDSKLYNLNSDTPLEGYQLATPIGYAFDRMSAQSVNASGQIVGGGSIGATSYAIVWDSPTSAGRVLEASRGAIAVNNAGLAAIVYGFNAAYWNTSTGAVAYLPTLPGGAQTFAVGVNNQGQIAGFAGEAFIWDAINGTRGIGTLGGDRSTAASINDKGQIVGNSRYDASLNTHGFIWEEGMGMVDIGKINPVDLDENGTVIGNVVGSGDHAAIWDAENGLRQLSTVADLEGYYITDAVAINNNGEILVQAYKNGGYHLLKLTAVPEPSTYAAMGGVVLGVAALVSRRKKRSL